MILRPATTEDTASLAALGRDSFCAAFAHLYSAENLNGFLTNAYSVEAVAAEIANPKTHYCIAEDQESGALLAFCKMRYPASYAEYSDAANPIVLAQLYADPARTGQGIGAKLMDWALDQAKQRQCDAVQLSVWSENFSAQRFYQRYGFAKIADISFWVGDHRDDEFLFELRL